MVVFQNLVKCPDDTFGPPTQDPTISIADRISLIRANLTKKAARLFYPYFYAKFYIILKQKFDFQKIHFCF